MALRVYWREISCLLAVVLLAYANVYTNGFLLDDEFLLIKNRFIADADYFWRIFVSSSTMGAGGTDNFFRPMQTLAYFIVVQIFGLNTISIHALNVLLHCVNVLLVFFFGVKKLGIKPVYAFCASVVWAAHPIHTEAVTYMSATADPLYTMFVLLGVFNFDRIWLACVFFVLGLGSKESAIVLLPMIVAVRAVKSRKPFDWREYISIWPMIVMAAVYLIARKTVLNFDNTFSFYKEANVYTENMGYRALTFLGTLPMYLKLLIWPSELHMERDFPVFAGWTIDPILGLVLLLLGVAAIFVERNRKERPLSFAFLWFMTAHIPHTGVLLPVNSLFLEHWMYLPSIGLLLGLCWWISLWRIRLSWPVVAVFSCWALALGVATFKQNPVWANPVSFYEHILTFARGNSRVHNNLGMAYSERGESDKAIDQYMKAVAIKDVYPQVRHNLAEELMKLGNLQEAIAQLKRALEIDPQFYYSYRDLAAIYQKLGDQEKAKHYYDLYQQLRPE